MKYPSSSSFAAALVILLVFAPRVDAGGNGVSVSIEEQHSLFATTAGLIINIQQPNVSVISPPNFLCFDSDYPEGLSDVHGNAHSGVAIIDSSLMFCISLPGGEPIPAAISVACTANGEESESDVSNGRFRGVGGSGHSHTTRAQNSADCTVDVDGTIYDAVGRITEQHTVNTIKQ